jgi:hypothetical protein
MKTKNSILIILALVLGVLGYQQFSSNTSMHDHPHSEDTHDHAPLAGEKIISAQKVLAAGTRIITSNQIFKVGNELLAFELYGVNGKLITNDSLKLKHEKKMHAVIVSSDFSSYQHIHPEFKDGLWTAQIVLDEDTDYRVYIDIDSIDEGSEVLYFNIKTGDPNYTAKTSQAENKISRNGIDVELITEASLTTKNSNTISFIVSKGNKLAELETYLGKKAHIIVLGEEPEDYIHLHPTEDNKTISTFLGVTKKGEYTIFAEFKVGGVVSVFPFSVLVEGEGTPSHDDNKPPTPSDGDIHVH